ncbi:MAG: ABC transporter ATP-binding protein [Planctomycetaceae bacterium]|jgi:lipoprotein-releasing system ATP-binding protein|nr:ABC transporter ATP-binding protein [Planctomycetaceae bacterium]
MPKHATAPKTPAPILEKPTSLTTTKIEFTGTSYPPVISVSGLVDELTSAISFFESEKIDTRKNTREILNETKNNQEQPEHVEKPISDSDQQDTEENKFKSVLQNLRKLRNRLTTTGEINETNNSNNPKDETKTEAKIETANPNTESHLIQFSDSSVDKTETTPDDNSVNINSLNDKNLMSEKRSPEERLLFFSADEVPLFEESCKLRFGADKLTSKRAVANDVLAEDKPKTQTDNSTAILSEDKIADGGGQNIDVAQISEHVPKTEDNDNESKPLLFSLFNGEQPPVNATENNNEDEVVAEVLAGNELLVSRGLEKNYFKGKLKIPVLNGVNFSAYRGEFISITGQSGSGKSTLLHLLGTLDKPDVGEIFFEGGRIDNLSVSFRDRLRNNSIGFIFQFYNLLPEFTAIENVLSPLMIRDSVFRYFLRRREYIERAKGLLDRVGLLHRLRHRPSELSGGEIQRVAIARSLIIEPKLLLADEPTGNLDSASAKEVIRILRGLNEERNLTIVMVTHDNSIASSADRIVRMSDGVIC